MSDEINSCLSELSDRISGLYAQAHELIKGDADPYDLKPVMFEINQVFSEMERAVLQESDAVTFADSLGSIQAQQLVKSEFDAKVTEWLESKNVPQREINQILGSSRTLRSKGMAVESVKSAQSKHKSIASTSKKTRSSKSSRTSASSRASSRVKVEAARLRVKQLEEKQQLERQEAALKQKRLEEEAALKQKRLEEEAALKQKALEEETSFKHKFEMLQASQQLEEAVLELQVLH